MLIEKVQVEVVKQGIIFDMPPVLGGVGKEVLFTREVYDAGRDGPIEDDKGVLAQ